MSQLVQMEGKHTVQSTHCAVVPVDLLPVLLLALFPAVVEDLALSEPQSHLALLLLFPNRAIGTAVPQGFGKITIRAHLVSTQERAGLGQSSKMQNAK